MRKEDVTWHVDYGAPLILIKRGPRNIFAAITLLLFAMAMTIAAYFKLPDMLYAIDGHFALAWLVGLYFFTFYSLFRTEEDIRFVIYENGFWSHKNILGSIDNFIFWGEVDHFERKNIRALRAELLYVVIHMRNKEKYDREISFFQKIFNFPIKNSYQYIYVQGQTLFGVVKSLETHRDNLLHYLNREHKKWRDSQQEKE